MWSVNGVGRNKRQFQSSYPNNWRSEVAVYHDEDPGNRCCGGNEVLIFCIVMSSNTQMVMGSKLREISLGSSGDKLRLQIWM